MTNLFENTYKGMTKEETIFRFSSDLNSFVNQNYISKTKLSADLKVSYDAVSKWQDGYNLPSNAQQSCLSMYVNEFEANKLEKLTSLEKDNCKWFSDSMDGVLYCFKRSDFNECLGKATKNSRRFYDETNLTNLRKDYYIRNDFYRFTALEKIHSQKLQEKVSRDEFDLILGCIDRKPSSAGLQYAIELKLASYNFEEARVFKLDGDKENCRKISENLFGKLNELNQLFPDCCHSLWDMARVASYLLEDIDLCKEVWSRILSHEHNFYNDCKINDAKKFKRAENSKHLDLLVNNIK